MATLNDPELQGQAQLNQVVAFSEFLNELAAQRHSVVKSYIGTPVRFISYSEVVERNDKLLADIDHLIRDTLGHIERTDLQPFDSITNSRQAEATPKTTPQPMTIDSAVEIIAAAIYAGGVVDKMNNPDQKIDLEKVPSDSRVRKGVEELKNLIAQSANKARLETMQKVSDRLDDLHQGTEGAGWVHYGEMGEWFDDEISRLTADKEKA